jgi:hypothetical protein
MTRGEMLYLGSFGLAFFFSANDCVFKGAKEVTIFGVKRECIIAIGAGMCFSFMAFI